MSSAVILKIFSPDQMVKVARTIVDLGQANKIDAVHIWKQLVSGIICSLCRSKSVKKSRQGSLFVVACLKEYAKPPSKRKKFCSKPG